MSKLSKTFPKLKISWQLGVAIALLLLTFGGTSVTKWLSDDSGGEEIQQILSTRDIKEQEKYYRQLLKKLGPVEAQERLFRSGIPFTGESHLLNHTAGDYIYENYGLEGITLCRNYFLESCYHGLLLHVISGDSNQDIDELKKIMDHCERAGIGVPSQCSHAIGHGYVAAVGYANLDTALTECDKIKDTIENFPLYNCHDGAFMENVFAVHEGGVPSPERWEKPEDDYYPCNHPDFKPEYLRPCWSNQQSILFHRYQGDVAKVGEICLTVNPEDAKRTCFDGLSRQINSLTGGTSQKVFELCAQLPRGWQDFCIVTNVNAFFSLGDRQIPFEICAKLNHSAKDQCYQAIYERISIYAKSERDRQELCARIAEADAARRRACHTFGG